MTRAQTLPVVEASRPGICPACGTPITPGEFITLEVDRDDWVHESCPTTPDVDVRDGEATCGGCGLIHPTAALDDDLKCEECR